MTEKEWLAATDPAPLMEFLRDKASDRKLRLFAVACCRRVLGLVPTKRNREGLEVAEAFADGMTTEHIVRITHDASLIRGAHIRTSWALLLDSFQAATNSQHYISHALSMQKPPKRRIAARLEEMTYESLLVRDIFPFRPITLDPSWLTSTVVSLAQQMYDTRDFTTMPILADALQDAGCDNAQILEHCRGPGPHVRGCWVCDLCLNKS
jgi:hypothetical protein